jgi:16S rRNA (guanine527-N7)-methyltransferase
VSSGDDLAAALELGRAVGFLGPGSVADHLEHSRAFVELVPADARFADLGAGGGVPGLAVAGLRPDTTAVLVESSRARADHLVRLVARLSLAERVVIEGRPAEAVGRDPAWRGGLDVVMARGFGPPAMVAECAAPLLRPGGVVLVAEPPEVRPGRWAGLAASGLPLALREVHHQHGAHVAELVLAGECPARFPRRAGVPAKQPLF